MPRRMLGTGRTKIWRVGFRPIVVGFVLALVQPAVAGEAVEFSPVYSGGLDATAIGASGAVTWIVEQDGGEEIARNVYFFIPPGFDLPSGDDLPDGAPIGHGVWDVVVIDERQVAPMTIYEPGYPGSGGGKAVWQFVIGPPLSFTVNAILTGSVALGHQLAFSRADKPFDTPFYLEAVFEPGIFRNPGTSGVYEFSAQFQSAYSDLAAESSWSACVGSACGAVGGVAEQPDVTALPSAAASSNDHRSAYAFGGSLVLAVLSVAGVSAWYVRRKRAA